MSEKLTPTNTITVSLPSGNNVNLPVSHPIFPIWNGKPINFNYGGKPLINYKGKPIFAELAILKILFENGWDGVWVETYGGTHYLKTMPNDWKLVEEHISIPNEKEELLKKIWEAGKTKACFDIFAWKGDSFIFCEAKHIKKDKLTNAQLRFIEGALMCGILPEALMIVEWEMI